MNEKEKVSYIKALVYIALENDTIEQSEEDYLEQMGKIYGLSEDNLSEIKNSVIHKMESLEEILAGLTERSLKLTLLYDLLALCYVDDNYSLIEKQGMRNICEIMGIESNKLEDLEAAMEEQYLLQKKINVILER